MILAALLVPRGRSPQTDQDIVSAVRAGDVEGFAELYRRHADRIFALFTRLVGPVGEREDLVQEAFVEAYRALPAFRGDAAFSTFLYRIAVRVGCDFLTRRTSAARLPLAENAVAALVAPDTSPLAQTEARAELARAFPLLESLSPKQRAAFVLVAIEGCSLREAAGLLDAGEQAVKQRVLAARKELSAKMAKAARGRSS
jgi:RNA polymerase sigma-70 factor (ECF subfamily)